MAGVGGVSEGKALSMGARQSRLEQRLMEFPEVQEALQAMQGKDLVSMEVRADGTLALRSGGGEIREVGVSEELKAVCLEVYSSRRQQFGLRGWNGESQAGGGGRTPVVEIPLLR